MGLWWGPLTVFARLKQALSPFNIGLPPRAPPVTASSCLLDEPVSADVVSVGNNHVFLCSWLLFRGTIGAQF